MPRTAQSCPGDRTTHVNGVQLFLCLIDNLEVSWIPAFVISVFIVGPLLGLGMAPIARRLSQQRTASKIAGTVGLTCTHVLVACLCL